jgi:diguanylate cyclase (GGDEF)-like protein
MWSVYLLVGGAAIMAYYFLPDAGVAQAVLLVVVNAASAAAALRAAARTTGPARLVWMFLGIAMCLSTLANAPYYGYVLLTGRVLPFPSPVDIFWLLTYPCFLVALVAIAKKQGLRARIGDILDATILVVAGASLMWEFVIAPVVHATQIAPLAHGVSIAYPVMDLLVFAVLMHLVMAMSHQFVAMRLLLASFTMLLFADVVYAITVAGGSYHYGGPTDGLWMASYLLVGAAALHPSVGDRRRSTSAATHRVSTGRLAFLSVAVLTGPVLIIASPKELVATAAASAVLFILIMIRVTGLNRQLVSVGFDLAVRASTDSLSGLANRAAFAARLEAVLSRQHSRSDNQAVLFVDLDDFKDVNDSLGHAAGDELLVTVARRLSGVVRPGDLVARLGGDEFALLLDPVFGAGGAMAVAERVVTALAEPVQIGESWVRVGASVGLAVRGDDSTSESLMHEADVAMYAAKGRGKHRVERYDASLDDTARARQSLRFDLEAAVGRGELVLDYQPVVDLTTGGLVGLEALVRWQHPSRGLLPPSEFIALAEATGAIAAIGAWVMETATRQLRQWQRRYGRPELWMSVNVSMCQLDSPGFADQVNACLAQTGLDPTTLVVEVTESVLADPDGGAAASLAALRLPGVRVALDDFGTGYSSIAYLRRLPVDILKIDRSFVSGSEAGGSATALLEAVVSIAKALGLDVIAEGIEEEPQLARLRRMGCGVGQGFLLARPQAAESIEMLLAAPLPLPHVGLVAVAPTSRR